MTKPVRQTTYTLGERDYTVCYAENMNDTEASLVLDFLSRRTSVVMNRPTTVAYGDFNYEIVVEEDQILMPRKYSRHQ